MIIVIIIIVIVIIGLIIFIFIFLGTYVVAPAYPKHSLSLNLISGLRSLASQKKTT